MNPAGTFPGARSASLWELYVSFLRVGAVMFGGGYAMLPLLEREIVQRRRWRTHDDMTDIYALSQMVPGVIAVNVSMFIGLERRGLLGAVCAALGAVTCPFLVILALAAALNSWSQHYLVELFLAGLRPAVAGLLVGTAFRLLQRNWRHHWQWGVGGTVVIAEWALGVSPFLLILSGVLLGLAGHLWLVRRHGTGGER